VIAARRVWPRAVDRNRFKRVARETFRRLQLRLQQRDYILRARSRGIGEASAAEIEKLLVAWCKPDQEPRV